MKKIYALIPSLLLYVATLSAQQITSTKGDKMNLIDLQLEPWNLVGTANKAKNNTDQVYQNASVGIGDFSTSTGNLPKLSIKPSPTSQEALQIQGVLDVNATSDSFSGASSTSGDGSFYDLKISEEGYVRRVKLTEAELNLSSLYDLKNDYVTPGLSSNANNQTNNSNIAKMQWQITDGTGAVQTLSDFHLPADGSYVFSFRLYGLSLATDKSYKAFYVYAFKDDQTVDVAELNLIMAGQATYSLNLTVNGRKGDKVNFGVVRWSHDPSWQLRGNPGLNSNKTSMFFWKL